MTFLSAIEVQKRFTVAFARVVGTAGALAAISLAGRGAIANDSLPTAAKIEAFRESNAINGILCIAACNEFFEAGQASFEVEIRSLQRRAADKDTSPAILQIEPGLVEALEEQREGDSLQNL